jgi:Ca-activated chloride channel family protein
MRVELLTDISDTGSAVYLLVRIEAQAPPSAQRMPVNLALVLDRSSSMRGPRITHAVAAVRQVVQQLDVRDRLSVIAFDASARSLFGPANVTPETRRLLDEALAGLRTGVGTNLAAGIKKGAEAVRSGFVRGAISRMVLLTDGQPSLGITDSGRLCALAEKEAAGGVSITTMGLGEGFDDELLAELARSGRGGFHYLAGAADIPGAFGRELAGVFAIAATQTEIVLRPAEHVTTAELVHRLPSRPRDDGLVVEMGELAAATPRQVLFQLTRPPKDTYDAKDARCGTLTVTYRLPDGSAGDAHLLGIEAPAAPVPEHRRIITLERTRLAVASAVDTAWARRASGDSMRALAALGEIKTEVLRLRSEDRADPGALDQLLQDIAEAEAAVVKSSAERERARRSMRERSHITLLGQSTVRRLPPGEEE